MSDLKTKEMVNADVSSADKELKTNCSGGHHKESVDGVTKLGELSAKVGEELTKIGAGGPWVWCVLIYFF